jgi:hypothetical protein
MMTLLSTKRIHVLESSLTVHMEMMFTRESLRFFILTRVLFPIQALLAPYVDFLWQDYTGEDVTVNNFFAALLGNKSALTGGSGKVVDSGPNDHIFVYYSDHGGPGVLG